MVDMDPDLRWCPNKDCEKYVRRKGKSERAKCECGTNVCMLCGEAASSVHVCGQSDEDIMFERWKLQ